VTPPSNGNLTLYSNGSYQYIHDDSETTGDSFVYEITDGNFTDQATVKLTITPVPDPPVIIGQNPDPLTTPEETSLEITLANLIVTDPDNTYPDDFTLTVQDGTNYSRTGNTITPDTDFNGTLTVPVTVNDGIVNSNVFDLNVSITPINDPPVITSTAPTTATEDVLYTYQLMVNDPDDANNGTDLIFTLSNQPAGMTVSATGLIKWTPLEGVTTSGQVIVTIADGGEDGAQPDTEYFTITVTAVPDPPVVSDIPNQTVAEGDGFTPINLDDYVSDVDNTDTEITWSYSGNNKLTVSITNRVATITIPDKTWHGSETITFTATDPDQLSDSDDATFRITPVNNAPAIIGTIPDQTKDEDASAWTLALTAYESDMEDSGIDLNWSVSGMDTALFTAEITDLDNDVLTFTPVADAYGSDVITLTLTDSGGLNASQDITITLNPVLDPPTAPTLNEPANLGTVTSFTPTLSVNNSSDVDSEALYYEFELYSDKGLSNKVASGAVPQGNLISSWRVSSPLTNNAPYYWRVRANDGGLTITGLTSPWMPTATFVVTVSPDSNGDGIIQDSELLDYIDYWANGLVKDFALLDTIDLWTTE
jgi:hypothetical protein